MSEQQDERYKNPDWLRKQYHDYEHNLNEIGEKCGVNDSTILYWMDKFGIKRRSKKEAIQNSDFTPGEHLLSEEASTGKLDDEQWLRQQYHGNERTLEDIGDECGVTAATVLKRMRDFGIERRSTKQAAEVSKLTGRDLPDEAVKKLQSEQWMREQYCEKGRVTDNDIAEELNVSPETVRNWLRKHGIEVRGVYESRLLEADTEKLNDEEWLCEQYIERRRSSFDIADELNTSAATVRKRLEHYGVEIRSGIQDPDHLEHKVRSSWELEIANVLSENDIQYEYEGIVISWGNGRLYTPDFITEDYVIEVKGNLYPGSYEVKKAQAAVDTLETRDYLLIAPDRVAEKLPCDIHIPWDDRESLVELFSSP